jgi:hypothetical protein
MIAGMSGRAHLRRRDAWLGAAIFCCFFGLNLLTTSRERPWADARAIYTVAESFVRHGDVSIVLAWPPGTPPGRLGHNYAIYPFLASFEHVPAAALDRLITERWPNVAPWSIVIACHLAPAAFAALACALLFLLGRDLGLSVSAASAVTVLCGLATSLWVYARYPYSEAVQAACYTGFLRVLVRLPTARRPRVAALVLGLWGSALINAKLVYVLAVAAAGALMAWWWRRDRRHLLRGWGYLALGMIPGVAVAAFYNWVRWGSPFASGYSPLLPDLFGHSPITTGLQGLFFSVGMSVFLYSPPLVLALAGLRETWRRRPDFLVVLAATGGPLVLLYASNTFWQGGWNWGPRYLVFLLPVSLLPIGFLCERWRELGRRWRARVAFTAALVAGGAVTVAGNAFYWDHFIRIAQDARLAWLGRPDRSGSIPPDQGGNCHSCFEDMYATTWLPAFQPIAGHFWLLRHVPFGDDWRTAERDAPWRRYTSLSLDIERSYLRARVDWWGLDYEGREGARAALVAVMTAIALAGAAGWIAVARRRDPTPTA